MPQHNYTQKRWVEGMLAEGLKPEIDTGLNPILAQVSTVTLAGVTDDAGDYTFTVTGPDGETATYTYTSAGSETSDAMATAIAGAGEINEDDDWANLADVTKTGTGELTFTFLHAGRDYELVVTVAGGTATIATTQSAGGASLPLARFLSYATGAADGLRPVRLPTTGDDDSDIAGISVRGLDALVRDFEAESGLYPPGAAVSVLTKGAVVMRIFGDFAEGGQVYVRITDASATFQVIGGAEAADDSTDTFPVTGCRFGSTGNSGELGIVRINRP